MFGKKEVAITQKYGYIDFFVREISKYLEV
jgi:hypothetical protein